MDPTLGYSRAIPTACSKPSGHGDCVTAPTTPVAPVAPLPPQTCLPPMEDADRAHGPNFASPPGSRQVVDQGAEPTACQSRDTWPGRDRSRLRGAALQEATRSTSRAQPPSSSFSAAKPEGNEQPKPPEQPRVLPIPYLGLSGTY